MSIDLSLASHRITRLRFSASAIFVSTVVTLGVVGCITKPESNPDATLANHGGSRSTTGNNTAGHATAGDSGDAGANNGEGGNQNGTSGGEGGTGGNDVANNVDAGQGGTGGSEPTPDAGGMSTVIVTDAGCRIETAEHPFEGATHVEECSVVPYDTNPPSSGNHYGYWAAFGVYDFALPRGYWMHNMEHGAVVITYNCPDGCEADLQTAIAWFNALPVDAACQLQGAPQPRALLVPDPLLDVRFAASSWLHTLRADCFDEVAFSDFYDSNAGHGLENICTSGQEFRGSDGMPTAMLVPGCGE